MPFFGDMLVPWRVHEQFLLQGKLSHDFSGVVWVPPLDLEHKKTMAIVTQPSAVNRDVA